jgi:predicted ATP-dependent protease
MAVSKHTPLSIDKIHAHVDSSELGFEHTDQLEAFNGVLGQDRAVNAIQFGVAMQRTGYNIYVMGEVGTGRSSYVKDYLNSEAKRQTTPYDWAYVNNFDRSREPKAINFEPGQASEFKTDIDKLIDNLLDIFPAAFEHQSYQQRKSHIETEFNRRYDQAIDKVERSALKQQVALFRESGSISFTPMVDGKAMDETQFAQLDDELREVFHDAIVSLENMLNDELIPLPQWKRESTEKLRSLNKETIDTAITPTMDALAKKYCHSSALAHIEDIRKHLHKTVVEELVDERILESREEATKRLILQDTYSPNLLTERDKTSGAPVIYETHPSYANIFGRIEFSSEQGTLVTNYRQICAGALHKANGGYLILDAEKLLNEPNVWEALKRAIKSRTLKMESPYSDMGLLNTTTLSPESIPLDVKIILIGSREIYYWLQDYDEDFQEMMRVLVDFNGQIDRNKESISYFSRLLKSRIDEEGYKPLSATGVARLIEYSSRLAEDQRHLSAQIGTLFELLAEAEFTRNLTHADYIEAEHVQRALDAKDERSNRISRQIQSDMLDGTILIDTQGTATGKINGLTVLSIGDSSFGAPARITATVYPGGKGIVDIEREVTLGQPIHSKGVMILSGYLGQKYAQRFPLEISAHITMEQSYGHIDGDSASLGEVCCLISALTNTPLKQSFAITGSINQYGEVQAIGGANEKIEGFFELCKARGLTGDQGVIIPESNIKHLALRTDVLEAVKAGEFSIYSVAQVDDALEILTGKRAGKLNKQGAFTRHSLNEKIVLRLQEIYELHDEEEPEEGKQESKKEDTTEDKKSDKKET